MNRMEALEFAITYGWAILITLVMIGALWYFRAIDVDVEVRRTPGQILEGFQEQCLKTEEVERYEVVAEDEKTCELQCCVVKDPDENGYAEVYTGFWGGEVTCIYGIDQGCQSSCMRPQLRFWNESVCVEVILVKNVEVAR